MYRRPPLTLDPAACQNLRERIRCFEADPLHIRTLELTDHLLAQEDCLAFITAQSISQQLDVDARVAGSSPIKGPAGCPAARK